MYAAITDPTLVALVVLVLVLFTPFFFMLANRLLRHLGVQGVTNPSYLKLITIALVLWAPLLILPSLIGGIVGFLFVWLLAYFHIVSTELRSQHFGRAVLVSSLAALCSLISLGVFLSLVYFAFTL